MKYPLTPITMKTTLLSLLFMLCTLLVQAQPSRTFISYTSIASGNWNNPAIWQATNAKGNPVFGVYPLPNANNIVTVSHAVNLNIDYSVTGNNGLLTIDPNGSLVDAGQRTLTIGQQTGSPQLRLIVQSRRTSGLALNLYKIDFIKASATINANIRTSSCSSFEVNSDITLTATFFINGNLVTSQGNLTINDRLPQAGTLDIEGRIVGYNANQIAQFLNVFIITRNRVIDCNAAPLPVELSSFTAAYGSNQVNLRWVTASEKNSSDFTVERSFDGETFSAVTKVAAAGTSSARREYNATDRGMRTGVNYYRLKQTDLDGTFSYSQVIPVQVGGVEQVLQAYGDNGNLNIVMQTGGALQTLRVLDSMGRVVYTESPTSLTTGLVTRQIPISGVNSRQIYMVQAITSEGVLNGKFIIAQ